MWIPSHFLDLAASVCSHLPARYEFCGNRYCILHLPDPNKRHEFETEFEKLVKAGGSWFSGIYFPTCSVFAHKTFEDELSLDYCTFDGHLNFWGTHFKDDVRMRHGIFTENSDLRFYMTRFEADLRFAESIIKGGISFEGSGWTDETYLLFEKEFSSIDFHAARIDNPQRITFHIVRLQPSWFVGVDCKDFTFRDCYWGQWDGAPLDIDEELYVMTRFMDLRQIPDTTTLLTDVCRQLAANYENTARYNLASYFRAAALEAEWLQRREHKQEWREAFSELMKSEIECSGLAKLMQRGLDVWHHLWDYPRDVLASLYRFSSGYGEEAGRAIAVFLGIVVFSAILYILPLATFDMNSPRSLDFIEAITYSVRVAILQRPEPAPSNTVAKALIAVEGLVAPAQLALVALALRRRFMR